MAHLPGPWQLALARIDGALPFLSPELAECVAFASLRRLWRIHVRDYPFENLGLEHNPGLEASELVRSWYSEERRQFLSWLSRRALPPLARAARFVLAAKGQTEGFTEAYHPADSALARLDALLPTTDPVSTLLEWLEELRSEEIDFLEGGSEWIRVAGRGIARPAPRGAAWAASLAVALRPHLFGLGSAPLALAGIMPRALFRELQEEPLPALLRASLQVASENAVENLMAMHKAVLKGTDALSGLYASSTAPQAWRVVASLGPLNRAELARGLGVTKRTASQAVSAIEAAGLIRLRQGDGAVVLTDA